MKALILLVAAATLVAPAWADRDSPGKKKAAKPAPAAKPAATPKPATPVIAPPPPAPGAAMVKPVTPLMPSAPGATPPAPAGPPSSVEIKETVFDGGTVDKGATLSHSYEIKNVGKTDATVDAKPGCGCTVVDFDKVIHPGAVGKVTASVNTVNFKGAITKSITVTTNDPAHATTVLQIKAIVRVPIDVQPSDTLSMDGKYGDLKPQVVTVSSTEDKPFDIISADSSDKTFTVAVVPTPPPAEAGKTPPKPASPKAGTVGSGNKSYQVTITPGKEVAVGHASVTVTLKTSHEKAAELPIRIFLTVHGEVDVQPERVVMQVGPNAPPAGKTQHVAIRKTTGDPLKILGVESTNPGVKTKLKTVTEGKEFDLEVSYDGTVPPNGFVDAQITVKTNDAKQATLTIPFFART